MHLKLKFGDKQSCNSGDYLYRQKWRSYKCFRLCFINMTVSGAPLSPLCVPQYGVPLVFKCQSFFTWIRYLLRIAFHHVWVWIGLWFIWIIARFRTLVFNFFLNLTSITSSDGLDRGERSLTIEKRKDRGWATICILNIDRWGFDGWNRRSSVTDQLITINVRTVIS